MPTPLDQVTVIFARDMARALAENTPTGTPTTIVAAALLAACTPLLLRVARQRTVAQPIPAHPRTERSVLRHLIEHPGDYNHVHQLRYEHFTDRGAGDAWNLLAAHHATTAVDENADSTATPQLADAMRRALGEETTDPEDSTATDTAKLIADASIVYNAGLDRTEYRGGCTFEATGDPDRPLRRVTETARPRRRLTVTALLAVGGALAAQVAVRQADPLDAWLTGAALVVLTIGSVLWALVDIDTMYIDLPTFYGLTAAGWALTILAGTAGGNAASTLKGLLVAAGIVAGIEIVNQAFKCIRGRDGMGGGDYLLIVATIGIPVGTTGDWLLGNTILLASLMAGIAGWIAARITRPGFTRETPYAFGPYLAVGWMLALIPWTFLP